MKYNVTGWMDSENPQCPDYMERCEGKANALRLARSVSKKYALVEVEGLEFTDEEETDLENTCLVAVWTKGKRTA